MRKVLIITYYWPPSGGSAVLRWLKFTKYLRNFGWEPVIYTPLNPEPQETDESLLSDVPENIKVIKRKIIEPYGLYKFLTGKKQHERLGVALMDHGKKKGFMSTVSLWIRSNLFIPDPRMLWIKPSIRYLSNYLKQNPTDVIITTGPPHSMHLIGLNLKKKLGIYWIADFRDPWTNIDFYRELLLSRYADHRHKKLERKVLSEADFVVTVSPGMTEEFSLMGCRRIMTITNGFDKEPGNDSKPEPKKFSMIHLGSLPKSRNPENLWSILSELIRENEAFRSNLEIILIGKSDQHVDDTIIRHGLEKFVVRKSYVPHNETLSLLQQSAVLLLCINNTPNARGILTNKFFEYLSARRPIIGIGPIDGDAAKILNEAKAGRFFAYDNTVALKEWVVQLFHLYSQNKLNIDAGNIEKYSRKNLTRQLSELLNNIIH